MLNFSYGLDPSTDFESLRRKVFADIQYVSFYINNQLQILNRNPNLNDKIKKIHSDFQERIK